MNRDSSLRFAIRTSKGITLSVFYPIQLSKNRHRQKGRHSAGPLRSVSSGMFPDASAHRTHSVWLGFSGDTTCVSEKHLGKNELQPGPRILDRAVARVKLCDGNCYNFQGAIVIPTIRLAAGLHNSLCRLALATHSQPLPPQRYSELSPCQRTT